MTVAYVTYDADGWGVGELCFDGDVLVWHELPRPRAAPDRRPNVPQGIPEIPAETLPGAESRVRAGSASNLMRRLVEAYFRGDRVSFGRVRIGTDGWTPFQLDVARALRRVPYRSVVTYGELAARAGHPQAQRAVGSFCARNAFPLVLPCHRVVASDGIGPYGSLGSEYKRRLLALERAV